MSLRGIASFTMILLLAASLTAAELTWNQSDLKTAHGSAELPDCQQVPVGNNHFLPARTVLLPLSNLTQLAMLSATAEDSTPLGEDFGAEWFSDDVTADDNRYHEVVDRHNTGVHLGSRPVEVVGQVVVDGTLYAKLMVFPVTVDTDGRTWFHSKIDLNIAGLSVDASALTTRDALSGRTADRESSSLASGPEYIIITSSDLAASLQPLADYRNETGLVTEIVLIEDALAGSTGLDDAEKLRNYLKTRYSDGVGYVLLAGDETVLPIRYAYHNATNDTPTLEMQQICDLYFADLTGNWDVDGDGVWGEAYIDQADLDPELRVGRLPINTADEASNYVAKLIRYETDPGEGDLSYLERTFFYASDQMRDYGVDGQHGAIASAFPDSFTIDSIAAVEISSGDDPSPQNEHPDELTGMMLNGFGIYNVIAHGRSDGYVFKSSGYNNWPKTYMLTDGESAGHGDFAHFDNAAKPAFYYSLACDNGAFDMDQPPFDHTTPNMAQSLIGAPGGAVGMIAYSRWGWIGASYLLQEAFFDTLFAYPERPAIDALTGSKETLYYYRDLMYGLNFFGDPALHVYTTVPRRPELSLALTVDGLEVTVTAGGAPLSGATLVLSEDGEMLERYVTDNDGLTVVTYPIGDNNLYKLTVVKANVLTLQEEFIPTLITDVDDDTDASLPVTFALHQNYPNPFNPSTTISFDLPERTHVRLTVYNLLGQTVAVLVDTELGVGNHEVEWNGRDSNGSAAASGVYFYRLKTEQDQSVRKMVLLK